MIIERLLLPLHSDSTPADAAGNTTHVTVYIAFSGSGASKKREEVASFTRDSVDGPEVLRLGGADLETSRRLLDMASELPSVVQSGADPLAPQMGAGCHEPARCVRELADAHICVSLSIPAPSDPIQRVRIFLRAKDVAVELPSFACLRTDADMFATNDPSEPASDGILPPPGGQSQHL